MIFKNKQGGLRWRVGLVMAVVWPSAIAQQTEPEPVQLPGIVMRWKSQVPDDMATTTVGAIERCMSGRKDLLTRRAQLDAEGQALEVRAQPLQEEHQALDLKRMALDRQFEQVRQEQADLASEGRDLDAQKLALQKARVLAG